MRGQQSNIAAQRQQLRTELKQVRASITAEARAAAAKQVSAHLLELPAVQQAKRIGAYFSVHNELPTGPVLTQLQALGKQLALPILHPFSPGQLLFLNYHSDTPMRANAFNIPEPELNVQHVTPLQQLDVLLVPLLGFDAQGNRIGMGGGYYDRTLAAWAKGQYPNLLPIGLAYAEQQVAAIPTETWDIPLPMIITPVKTWHF